MMNCCDCAPCIRRGARITLFLFTLPVLLVLVLGGCIAEHQDRHRAVAVQEKGVAREVRHK